MVKKVIVIFYIIIFYVASLFANNKIHIIKSQKLDVYNDIVSNFEISLGALSNYDVIIFDGRGFPDRIEKYILELLESSPELIITVGIQSSFVANNLVDDIPVIFCAVHEWDKYLIKKDNITGISMEISPEVIFNHIKLISPDLKNVGILYEPQFSDEIVSKFQLESKNHDMNIIKNNVRTRRNQQVNIRNLRRSFLSISDRIDIFYLLSDPSIINIENFNFLLDKCFSNNIPLFSYDEEFVRRGALASLSPDYANIGTQLAVISRQILLNNISPADIDVVSPIGSSFVLNANSAEKLDINIDLLRMIVNKLYY